MTEQEKNKLLISFGRHLKSKRLKLGISAAELARRTYMEKSHISRLEKGETNPTLVTLKKICDALEVDFSYLFKEF